jgi:UDP-N-acetylmuramoyl-L-alanyl-D-glutamate--2,6-diaminopimelate ligase
VTPAGQITFPWRLSVLLAGLVDVPPHSDVAITGLTQTSQEVRPGDLFLAIAGKRTHGLRYLHQAMARGAAAVAWEAHEGLRFPADNSKIPHFQIQRLGWQMGLIAGRFYQHPSRHMKLIGVTGTDGKTSVSHFIAQALNEKRRPCGVIGTLGYGLYGSLVPGLHTTPEAIRLQAELHNMRRCGTPWVTVEVSSHGLDQGRVNGTFFDAAVLTNISRDHFDYHGDFESYVEAKQRLFHLPGLGYAILNLDDVCGRALADKLSAPTEVWGYTLEDQQTPIKGGVRTTRTTLDENGIRLEVETPLGHGVLTSGLIGRFNAYNLLAALAVLLVLKLPLSDALRRLSQVNAVAGRMESFGAEVQPRVIVDYAHTPAALTHALTALRVHCQGRLWCVFGCGGDRDRGKRPAMAQAAERLADEVIVTDDNPRNEDPKAIANDILRGFDNARSARVIHDRGDAIAWTISQARRGDIVLVAGKGHETTQSVRDRQLSFSDRHHVTTILAGKVS